MLSSAEHSQEYALEMNACGKFTVRSRFSGSTRAGARAVGKKIEKFILILLERGRIAFYKINLIVL